MAGDRLTQIKYLKVSLLSAGQSNLVCNDVITKNQVYLLRVVFNVNCGPSHNFSQVITITSFLDFPVSQKLV